MAFGGVSEKNTEKQNLARIALKRLQATWKQKSYTQQEKVSRFYYFLPLFWTIPYDRFIPIQTLIITLFRSVMLTVPRELGLPVMRRTRNASRARGEECKKINACTHTIVQAVPVILECLDITRSHIYSLITYSDLNEQQINSSYNCTVNLTENTVK